jgi:hypothetical protein
MSSSTIVTLVKMLESLPESAQTQVLEHLRDYVADLQDELTWDALFERTQEKLVVAAQRAKQEIAEGRTQPMDHEQL